MARKLMSAPVASAPALEMYHFQFVGNGANALSSYRGKGLVISRVTTGRIKIKGPHSMKNLVHVECTMSDVSGQGNLKLLNDEGNSNTSASDGFDVRLTCTTTGNSVSDVPATMRVTGILFFSPRDWGKGL
jgi:hypothetical protein